MPAGKGLRPKAAGLHVAPGAIMRSNPRGPAGTGATPDAALSSSLTAPQARAQAQDKPDQNAPFGADTDGQPPAPNGGDARLAGDPVGNGQQ